MSPLPSVSLEAADDGPSIDWSDLLEPTWPPFEPCDADAPEQDTEQEEEAVAQFLFTLSLYSIAD